MKIWIGGKGCKTYEVEQDWEIMVCRRSGAAGGAGPAAKFFAPGGRGAAAAGDAAFRAPRQAARRTHGAAPGQTGESQPARVSNICRLAERSTSLQAILHDILLRQGR